MSALHLMVVVVTLKRFASSVHAPMGLVSPTYIKSSEGTNVTCLLKMQVKAVEERPTCCSSENMGRLYDAHTCTHVAPFLPSLVARRLPTQVCTQIRDIFNRVATRTRGR